MTTNRRGPRPPEEHATRRPNDTEAAIDDVVDAAAKEVQRRLDAEGAPKAIVTPRDVLRSRYPRDTVDDEAVTEEMNAGDPFARPVGTVRRHPPSGTSSLSPLAIDPRSSRAPTPVTPRLGPHARRVESSSAEGRGPMRSLRTRAPSGAWVLLFGLLGGVAAFATVMAVRSADSTGADPPRRAAAAAEPVPLADGAAMTTVADAAAGPSSSVYVSPPPPTPTLRPGRAASPKSGPRP